MRLIVKGQVTAEERRQAAKEVDPKEIEMGIKVELEHTGSRDKAREIALDHLAENPNYYSELKESGISDELEKAYAPGTIRTHGGVKKMKTPKGTWVPVKKLKQKRDKPAGKQDKTELRSPAEDWEKNGLRSKVFKSWFGDWENNPDQASKVVDSKGRPQEQHNTSRLSETPKPVYHGTATGGYTEFDPGKTSEENLYGAGFYFTEDKGIAQEYLEKEDPSENVEIDHQFTPQESDEIRDYIEGVSNSDRFKEYPNEDKRNVLLSFLQPYQAYRENNRTRTLVENFVKSSLARGGKLGEDVKNKLDEMDINYEVHGKPTVYEVYLNIRKPFDLDNDKIPVSNVPGAAEQRVSRGGSKDDELSYRSILKLMYPENRRKSGMAGMRGKEELNKALRDMGYDGMTHIGGQNMGSRLHRVWIGFEPTQIKSTENEGTFDPKNPDITKSMMDVFSQILKARGEKAQVGEVRVWSDGRRMKKMPKGEWKKVGGRQQSTSERRKEKVEDKGEKTFDDITSGHGLPSMVAQEVMEDEFGISSYDDLVDFVQTQAKKPSQKIGQRKDAEKNPLSRLYQRVKAETKSELADQENTHRGEALGESSQNMLKQLASLLIDMRDAYKAPVSEEQKLTVRTETRAGKTTVGYKQPTESEIPKEQKQKAAKKLKGWQGNKIPTASKVNQLLKTKWAKTTKGSIDPKKKFELRGAKKGNIVTDNGVVIPFRENEEGIKVYLEQKGIGKRAKTKSRRTTTAQVELTVPYSLAEDFLLNNVPQAKTRSNLIGQLKRSAGYKRAIGG